MARQLLCSFSVSDRRLASADTYPLPSTSREWASLGMTLGKMYEAKLLVEAGGGVGSIDYTLGTMTAQ